MILIFRVIIHPEVAAFAGPGRIADAAKGYSARLAAQDPDVDAHHASIPKPQPRGRCGQCHAVK